MQIPSLRYGMTIKGTGNGNGNGNGKDNGSGNGNRNRNRRSFDCVLCDETAKDFAQDDNVVMGTQS